MAKTATKKTVAKKVVEKVETPVPVVKEVVVEKIEPVVVEVPKIAPKSTTVTNHHGPWQGSDPDGIAESIAQYKQENGISNDRVVEVNIGYNNEKSCFEGWITYETIV